MSKTKDAMKRIINIMSAMAAIAALAISCSKEKDINGANGISGNTVRFTATSSSVESKTTIEDGSTPGQCIVKWAANDKIDILWDGGRTTAQASVTGDGTTADFEATVESAASYYAVYPAAVDPADLPSLASDVLSVSVPASQDGTFASANIAVAKTDALSHNLAFYNATALVKFSVSDAAYTKAVFAGTNSEAVAGEAAIDFGDGSSAPTITAASTAVKSVEVTLSGAGEYYFAVLPGIFSNGFSITLFKGANADRPKSVQVSKTLGRASILDMGAVDGVAAITNYFAKPDGTGSGKSWEKAMGPAQLKALLETSSDSNVSDAKARLLDGVTIHMAVGNYDLAGDTKIEFNGYANQVDITFMGGYPDNLTGTATTGRDTTAYRSVLTSSVDGRVIVLGNQTDITFEGITFKDANLDVSGGALTAGAGETGDCSLTLKSCRFIGNTNTDANTGAAVYLSKASATISDCYFWGNHARNGAGINLNAGEGTVSISKCLFEYNTTFNTSGALQNGSVKTVTVTDCVFDHNTAGSYGGGAFHTNATGASTSFSGCTFSNNSAAQGGAVSIQVGEATFTNCTFTGNSATNGSQKAAGDGDDDVLAAQAGGVIILHHANSVCNLNNCSFTNNTAPNGNGGAIASENVAATLNINAGTTFTNCSSYGPGGAIFARKVKLNINGTSASKVTFSGCKTLATGNQHGNGGAIWLGDGSTTSVEYATFSNNEAGQESGSTVNYSNGGAFRMKAITSFQASNCEFSGNRSRNGMCVSLELGSSSVCKFTDCNFHENIGRSGASKDGTGGNFHGGVAQLGDNGTVSFEGCSFTDNVAYHGSGAIHQNGKLTTVNCKNCTFTHNTAINGNGGCVTIESTGTMNLDGCTFTNNSVTATSSTRRDGGVFYMNVAGSALTAKGCTFTGNTITGDGTKNPYGGVLRVGYGSEISFTDCVFDGNGNSVVYSGGCISLNQDAHLKLDNCLFKNNVSKTRGVIQGGANALVYMNNVTFYNNTTTGSGGWGVNAHMGNANVCMNNVTSIGNHCTNASPGNCASFTGDGGWLVVNSTIIDSTPTAVVRRGGSNGRYAIFCNDVLINTHTANNSWALNQADKFVSKGHNVLSTSGTYNNAAPDANDLLSQTSLPSGAYSEHWSATPHYAVYTWSGSLSGFSAATQADVTAAIAAYTETDTIHTDITSIGANFKSWLESLSSGYAADGRGVARTGTWWPGAYQQN